MQHSPQTANAGAPLNMELVPDPGGKQEEDEPMDESNEPLEYVSDADVPGKGNSVQMFQKRNREIGKKRHLNALKIYKTIIHHSVGD